MEVPSMFKDTKKPFWYYLLLLAAGVCCESTHTWRCSPPSDNVFYFPDIPATVPEIGSTLVEATAYNLVYIYPTDSLNCSGTVTGVEYCYQPDSDEKANDVIFTLLIFDKLSSNTTDMDITEIPIPTPGVSPNCSSSDTICCDSYRFIDQELSLHSDNFIFGILTSSSGNKLYGFHSAFSTHKVNAHLFNEDVLRSGQLDLASEMRSLRIVRLILNSRPTTTTSTLDTTTTSPQLQKDSQNNTLAIAVGTTVGLAVLIVLLCVSTVAVGMCLHRSRNKDLKPERIPTPNNNSHRKDQDQSIVTTDNSAYHSVIPGSCESSNSEPLYVNERTITQGNQGTSDHMQNCSNDVIMASNEVYIVGESQQDESSEYYENVDAQGYQILTETDDHKNNGNIEVTMVNNVAYGLQEPQYDSIDKE